MVSVTSFLIVYHKAVISDLEFIKEIVHVITRIIKTISKGVVLIISPFFQNVYVAGVATCGIISTSAVDLFLYYYSFDCFEVTQTTAACLNW